MVDVGLLADIDKQLHRPKRSNLCSSALIRGLSFVVLMGDFSSFLL